MHPCEVREAIEIRRRGAKTLNREEGTYLLSHVYDPLIMMFPDAVRQNINFVSKKPGFVTHNYILTDFPNKQDESIHQKCTQL